MLLRVCVMLSAASQLSVGLDEQWEQWKSTYRKQYKDDAEEEDHRIVWRQNRYMIEAHNREAERGRHSYTLELNHRGDEGSLDMEILKEMLGQRAENSGRDEILEEILGVIAEFDLLTRKYVVEKMMEVTELDDLSQTEILDTMTDRMVLVDQAVTQLILEKVEETFSDYDQKARKRILKNIEQTLSEYNRMSRKLVQDKMTVKMESGRTSQSDILRDVTEAIDESKIVAKKLILEQIAEMLANYDKTDPQEKLSSLPKSLDLREKGLVTPVRDQGNCGSCWAFSAAGALEGQLAKTDQLVELSPQNLVDCNLENTGCDGGHMSLAFKYVIDNGGLSAEEDYPYAGKQRKCRYQPSAAAAQCKGFKMIPKGDERALARALFEVGPLSVAINSEDRKFQFYKSGVYYNPDCVTHSRAHAMLLVGYGATANGQKYWLVKNSWGERWGEKGYIRIARNRGNHCGIASEASYPLMGARRKEVG